MISRIVCMLAVGLTLTACSVGQLPQKAGPVAWDGLGRDPDLPPHRQRLAHAVAIVDPTVEEDASLASLTPRSSEFFAAQRKIDADRDKRLAAKLIICRGCSEPGSKGERSEVAPPTWLSEIR